MSDFDTFRDGLEELEETFGAGRNVAAAFDAQLRDLQGSLGGAQRDAGALSAGIGRGLRRAFDGLILEGDKLGDALSGIARSIADTAYSAAVAPVARGAGGLISGGIENVVASLLPGGGAGGFAQGRVMPFAKGGVVSGPVAFPMQGGTGLMGEAGPEAIMPLARGPDYRLGVRGGAGARPVTVVMNITTPDAEGFARSRSQIAARMSRAIASGQRNR
ncbi:phage tail tape measure protein [Profundibacterium mesophilum]|uniref:Phage tail protein n=1 Tax=Profundibacterium mesophilum KAUST100406-0324 TaxID=1037889 RepID=A0A921NSX2_9RHOB|nr:phage tail tape measure protein [Profundibacterium mesophilum]KAF0677420.1 hypothetical protein PMES_00206 [Profundibacterium mesophilum KAUST100406-0324]